MRSRLRTTHCTLALIDGSAPRTVLATLAQGRDAMRERRPLTSWKEISRYLGHGIRTVQRYEVNLGLPIHRPAGKQRSSVLAFPDELDFWLRSTPLRKRVDASADCQCEPLDTTDTGLRTDLQRAEEDLKQAVEEYQRCLERYQRLKNSFYLTSGSSEVELMARAG